MIDLRVSREQGGKVTIGGRIRGETDQILTELTALCLYTLRTVADAYAGQDDIYGALERELTDAIRRGALRDDPDGEAGHGE